MPSDSPPLTDKPTRRRGRPPKDLARPYTETRRELIQAGLALLTEKGYSSVGIDQILRSVNVPKGSFYHYFKSKEAFGLKSDFMSIAVEGFNANLGVTRHFPVHILYAEAAFVVSYDFTLVFHNFWVDKGGEVT